MNDVDTTRKCNALTVETFYEAERRRDIEAWRALWAPEGRHTFWLSSPTPPIVGVEALVTTTRRKFEVRPPYDIGVVVEPLADPSRILARLHLTMTVPTGATADLWCLFHFDERGRITEIEEIVDTATAPAFPD